MGIHGWRRKHYQYRYFQTIMFGKEDTRESNHTNMCLSFYLNADSYQFMSVLHLTSLTITPRTTYGARYDTQAYLSREALHTSSITALSSVHIFVQEMGTEFTLESQRRVNATIHCFYFIPGFRKCM